MPKKNVEYKSIKCKLKSVLKHDEWLPLIKKRVDIVNRIWLEAYNLFNLYILVCKNLYKFLLILIFLKININDLLATRSPRQTKFK
jgi:hypothetical protein